MVEAKLAGGALVQSPANGTHSGRKWRVLVFEYGRSQNRYPWHAQTGSGEGGMGNGGNPPSHSPLPTPRNDPADAGPFRLLPLNWTERSGRQALRHLDGARCFADHVSEGNGTAHSVRDLIGFFSEPALGPRGPEATLTLLASERWAREKLLAAWEAGRAGLIGFSIDAVIAVRPVGEGADRALEVEDIAAIHSVDMVSAPSSGGRALGVLENQKLEVRSQKSEEKQVRAGEQAGDVLANVDFQLAQSGPLPYGRGSDQNKGAIMKQEIQRMLEALGPVSGAVAGSETATGGPLPNGSFDCAQDRQDRPDRRGSDFGPATQELRQALESELAQPEVNPPRVLAALAEWLDQSGTGIPACRSTGQEARNDILMSFRHPPELARVREQVKELRAQIGEAERRQRMAENRLRVDGKLAASRLPKPLAELVASRFREDGPLGGSEISEEVVEMEIQRVREAYAALSPVGRVLETGRVKVVREPEEKMQMALDRLFGLPVEDTGVPAFHGIREAYVAYTGDGEVAGTVSPHLRVREDYTTAGFPNALGNTLRRMLLKDYRDQDFGIGLIAQFSSVPDFRTQERVRVGYFGDLPTVATESADYGELTAPTDEKATYSVVTFGGLVTVTRKAIINDDIGIVPQIVGRLGRSARRTLAQRVFNLMINNGVIYDGLAWFHATHGNLGTTALSAAQLDIVRTAMRNRTEKDSGKKLGIAPHVLVVPHELEGLARQENERGYVDASFTPNRVRFMFGQQSERIIVSPLLSDANDWYVFANVQEAPTVEVGFLQGQQEPEFFLADQPTAAAVFTSDKIRYKVRHEHEAVVIDFRGAYKEAVV